LAINIGKISVNNSVLINVLMITILVLGAFSLWQLPQEQFPEIPFFWVNIIVPYPGVSAEDIENTVTIKIEKELQGLDKLKQISSVTSEGQCVVRVEFEDGISNQEFLSLFQDTRTRFSRIELPAGVLNPVIDDFSTADFQPVIEVVLWGDAEYSTLKRTAVTLRNRLLGIPEVSGIELAGARDKQILVQVDKKQIEVLGIPLDLVARAISERNITVPGGILETENREYLLRTSGTIENYSDLYDVIIRQSTTQGLTANYPVYIRNVAAVEESYDPEGIRARFNGKEAITLKIAKVPRGSSIAVTEQVKQEIEDFTPLLPAGLQMDLLNDSTVQIRDSIDVLLSNALMGFILLIIILLLFIGLRNALITAIGIPVTFAITFIIFQFLGETFNTSTLFGLVLVLGLIVDDAIVIVENCYRYEQQGLSKREAAVKGINQVALPVLAATLTTVAAFLPLMILPGTIGRFLRVIPLTVVIALLASTSEATIFLPSHYADWPAKTRQKKRDLFLPVMRVFEKVLEVIYKKKMLIIILFILIMIAVFALVPFIQQDLFSAEDYTYFYIDITMPRGTNIHKTDKIVAQFEQKILPLIGNSEILSVSS
jgi:multidrug efflux pump subunit AcrB